MKKIILILFLLILPLTGCTQKQANPEKTEIEFWTIQLSAFSGYINNIIDEYEALHPDIEIKWIDVPFSEAEKRALAVMLSGDVPDLINMNPEFGATLASKGALLNIKNIITKEQYDAYIDSAWQASSINGFIYGIPWYITSAVTFTNKQIWKGDPPKTYDDLLPIAQKIDKYVLMPSLTENAQILKLFNKYDIPIVNKNRDKAAFNTKKAEEVLGFWKNMYSKGYIPKESITDGHREALEKFMAGETAFIVTGENFINIIKENAPQIYANLGISRQLTGSNDAIDFSIMNFVIPKKSSHPKEALDFALYITNAANQEKFSNLVPVKSSASSSHHLNDKLLQPLPALNNRKDLYDIVDFMTQDVMLGNTAIKPALDNAAMQWDKILAE